jgi:hypothetical protein
MSQSIDVSLMDQYLLVDLVFNERPLEQRLVRRDGFFSSSLLTSLLQNSMFCRRFSASCSSPISKERPCPFVFRQIVVAANTPRSAYDLLYGSIQLDSVMDGHRVPIMDRSAARGVDVHLSFYNAVFKFFSLCSSPLRIFLQPVRYFLR